MYSLSKANKIIAVFVGHFSPSPTICAMADSPAGNQVHRKINDCLSKQCEGKSICLAMPTASAFPKGPLLVRSKFEDGIEFLGYINLPIVKHIIFAAILFWKLLVIRPRICIQYNSFLFENLALYSYKIVRKINFNVAIIQDIAISDVSSRSLKKIIQDLVERAGLFIIKKFDLIVPVSVKIIEDFNLSKCNNFIFIGGVTDFAEKLNSRVDGCLSDIAVYAGKLEKYNGFDLLVKAWIAQDIKIYLHIFGKGSLEKEVSDLASNNKFIIFHGHRDETEVMAWQARALWNFCLRYSIGIDQDYFFPSKLFNICCAPGAVVVNNFNSIPEDLLRYMLVINEDLGNLHDVLINSKIFYSSEICILRRAKIVERYSWDACVGNIFSIFSSHSKNNVF